MPREFRHALDDMLAATDGIAEAVSGKTLADYQSSWVLRHAVQRGIEIISEASRALPVPINRALNTILHRGIAALSKTLNTVNSSFCYVGSLVC